MLPLTLQFVIAMLAHALNEQMARRVEYLQEEVRVLKEVLAARTGRTRMILTPGQRRRLALKGKALTPEDRRAFCQIARPETILAWFRHLSAKKYDSSAETRTPGRPRKAGDIRDLVIKLATENPGWGYTKIRDALRGLKIEIGRTTVASILANAGLDPAPERSRRRTWRQFLGSHWETLYACDFFSVETLGAFCTVRFMVFFVMELKSRAVHIAGVRVNPDGAFMAQLARNLLDPVDGFLRNATYLIRPTLHPGVDDASRYRRRRVRAHSGSEPKLQPVRGTSGEDRSLRVLGPLRDLRGATSSSSARGVPCPLPLRAVPPGHRQQAHPSASGPECRQRHPRRGPMPFPPRRATQLLSS